MATNQPKGLRKRAARSTARATGRAEAKKLAKGGGRRRQARKRKCLQLLKPQLKELLSQE